jgi:hypothetical protein
MNKEQQQIIDEAYESFMLQNGFKYENGLLVGKMGGLNQLNVTYWLSKEEFINKCKTDNEFSEKWGLQIEERELSLRERTEILVSRSDHKKDFYDRNGRLIVEEHTLVLDESNIPTKLITITYNDKIIESYE